MKLAIVTDTHAGARGDSPIFNEFFMSFWEKIFFPYLETHNIQHVVHMGDIMDRRKFVNYVILHDFRTRVIDRLRHEGIDFTYIVGNHDIPYRNSNKINAMAELFGKDPWFDIYSSPNHKFFEADKPPILMLPWIHAENLEETLQKIEHSKAKIVMGHLEIAGFKMDKNTVCGHGIDKAVFDKFDKVFSGHFHHRSTDGKIMYLGNPYEITWADYGDQRGFHIFDTDTHELEFIENPLHIFHRIEYDETKMPFDVQDKWHFDQYKNAYVQVLVVNKTDAVKFDQFLTDLNAVSPADVKVADDVAVFVDNDMEIDVSHSEDTGLFIDRYIEGAEFPVDKDRLRQYMKDLHKEAQGLDV